MIYSLPMVSIAASSKFDLYRLNTLSNKSHSKLLLLLIRISFMEERNILFNAVRPVFVLV